MANSTSEAKDYFMYRNYRSIWREIDNGNYYKLQAHPDLVDKINEKDQDHTPLFLACLRKNHQIVYYLLSMGADANTGNVNSYVLLYLFIEMILRIECCTFEYISIKYLYFF